MAVIDFTKELKDIYLPSSRFPSLVDVPPMQFAMIDGKGNPDSPLFQTAVEALYTLSYGIKMRPQNGISPPGYFKYVVPPLEGVWWSEDNDCDLCRRDNLSWTLMIYQPVFVKQELVDSVIEEGMEKDPNPLLKQIRLERWREGVSVQMTHVGSYGEEFATVGKLMHYIEHQGYKLRGKHHEIYLSSPRYIIGDKARTVVRYPVVRV